MAYRSFTAWPEIEAVALYGATHAEAAPLFTPLEYQVIAIGARSDVRREVDPESRFARWMERLFGYRFQRPLADLRLEALRRFASLVGRSPDGLDGSAIERFIAAGFSSRQAEWLMAAPRRARALSRVALA